VVLWLHAFNGYNDDVWDTVGQAVGNLQALESLHISFGKSHFEHDYSDADDDGVVPPVSILSWERLARILSHTKQKVKVSLNEEFHLWAVGEVQALARAIHGHPTITRFDGGSRFAYES
jgi:hypothetical protein